MKIFHSIKAKLIIMMLVLLIIPLVIVGFINYSQTAVLEKSIIPKNVLEQTDNDFKQTFDEYEGILQQIAQSEELQHEDQAGVETSETYSHLPGANEPELVEFYEGYLSEQVSDHEYILNSYLATPEGAIYFHLYHQVNLIYRNLMQQQEAGIRVQWTSRERLFGLNHILMQ